MSQQFFHPGDALDHQATTRGNEIALRFPRSGGSMTFAEWRDEAQALAAGLAGIGLRAGDHIALVAENRREWPVVQLAVALFGGVFVPINTHSRHDDLRDVLALSEARAVLTVEAFRSNAYLDTITELQPKLPALDHVVAIGSRPASLPVYDDLIADGADAPAAPRVADADAALLFTSGTTGQPKGAMLTHRGMMMNAYQTAQRLGIVEGDRWTSIIPLFHCAGCIMNLLGCLQTGARYVGVPSFDPVGMFEVIDGERCTALSGVPTSYLAMLDHPERTRFDLTSLRTGSCGGADCNPETLKACAEAFPMPELCQVYGQTESSTIIAAAAADDPQRLTTAGQPLPGYEVRIVDPTSGDQAASGEIGEIQARGPMVMSGYYAAPEATAETIIDGGWLRTGDLGALDDSGRILVAGGRLRDMIIRGGENIYPAEIENLLLEHPAIASAAVFALPDDYYGEKVAAAVILSKRMSAAEIDAHCRKRLAGFKVPAIVFEAHDFPLTSSGKIRKTELRAEALDGDLHQLE